MKNCRHLTTRAFILALLFSGSGLVLDVQGQQPIDELMPHEFSEPAAIQTIARLQSKMYAPSQIGPILQLQLEVLKTEADFHNRMKLGLEEMQAVSEEQSIRCNHMISAMISDAESSMPLVDRETTALQMRNCLIELQRIEWEIATEKGLPTSKAPDAQIGSAKQNIEARKAELAAIESKIQSLQKGTDGETEIKLQIAKLRAVEAGVDAATARLDLLASSTTSDSAARVSQLVERMKVVNTQLDMLKKQRGVWMSIESKQAELRNLRKRSEAIAELQTESDLKQLSRKTTIAAIEDAFKNIEVDNADATTQPAK